MRIALDARKIRDTGIGRYIEGLLSKLASLDERNEYLLIAQAKDIEYILSAVLVGIKQDRFRFVVNNAQAYTIDELVSIPLSLLHQHADLFHSPHYVVSPYIPCNLIVTTHDLIHLLLPEHVPFDEDLPKRYGESIALQLMAISTILPQDSSTTIEGKKGPRKTFLSYAYGMMKNAVNSSQFIIAVSENTKKDIINYFDVPESKVKVIYEAADDKFRPIHDQAKITAVRNKYGITGRFAMYIGRWRPHKNLLGLIKTYRDFIGASEADLKLVIVGRIDPRYPGIPRAVNELGLENLITFTGYVPDEDLIAIYNAAHMLILPSFYEGFGLPVVEAMACGTPVIASNVSSLPEVIGNAGLLIDPYNPTALVQAMKTLLEDHDLYRELSYRGLQRVRRYSWDQAARETLRTYEEAYSSTCGPTAGR
jgi:glycosyltransferase involved in cell wall biosynthesis